MYTTRFFSRFTLLRRRPQTKSIRPILNHSIRHSRVTTTKHPNGPYTTPRRLFTFEATQRHSSSTFTNLPFHISIIFITMFLRHFISITHRPRRHRLTRYNRISRARVITRYNIRTIHQVSRTNKGAFTRILQKRVSRFSTINKARRLIKGNFALFTIHSKPRSIIRQFSVLRISNNSSISTNIRRISRILPTFFIHTSKGIHVNRLISRNSLQTTHSSNRRVRFVRPRTAMFRATPERHLRTFNNILHNFTTVNLRRNSSSILTFLSRPSTFKRRHVYFTRTKHHARRGPRHAPLHRHRVPSVSGFHHVPCIP